MNRLKQRFQRRFLRDPENGWLGGVCEGIARGLGLPADGMRIAAVIAGVLFTTPTILAYVVAWLFMDSREEVVTWKPSQR